MQQKLTVLLALAFAIAEWKHTLNRISIIRNPCATRSGMKANQAEMADFCCVTAMYRSTLAE